MVQSLTFSRALKDVKYSLCEPLAQSFPTVRLRQQKIGIDFTTMGPNLSLLSSLAHVHEQTAAGISPPRSFPMASLHPITQGIFTFYGLIKESHEPLRFGMHIRLVF